MKLFLYLTASFIGVFEPSAGHGYLPDNQTILSKLWDGSSQDSKMQGVESTMRSPAALRNRFLNDSSENNLLENSVANQIVIDFNRLSKPGSAKASILCKSEICQIIIRKDGPTDKFYEEVNKQNASIVSIISDVSEKENVRGTVAFSDMSNQKDGYVIIAYLWK